jgi:hypothetical protein
MHKRQLRMLTLDAARAAQSADRLAAAFSFRVNDRSLHRL